MTNKEFFKVMADVITDQYIQDLREHFLHPDPNCEWCATTSDSDMADLAYKRTIDLIKMLRHLCQIAPK